MFPPPDPAEAVMVEPRSIETRSEASTAMSPPGVLSERTEIRALTPESDTTRALNSILPAALVKALQLPNW